ncbi:hypothetical protein ACFOG5_10055 [Pedobacter fastidiosus]|uniref:hypothetical protein n=1 Tax=Pedobacter fastidiosus TaxID=2765361 RepID=UPI0036209DA1
MLIKALNKRISLLSLTRKTKEPNHPTVLPTGRILMHFNLNKNIAKALSQRDSCGAIFIHSYRMELRMTERQKCELQKKSS